MRKPLLGLVGLLMVIPTLVMVSGGTPAEAGVTPHITLNVFKAPIAQNQAGRQNRTSFWGTVTPARRGARVVLQRRTNGVWKSVVWVRQDRDGRYRGTYIAWPNSTETLRVRSRPGRISRTISSPIRQRRTWKRVFHDDFSGTALNLDVWYHRLQPAAGGRMCSRPGRNRVEVGNGVATLSIRKVADWCAESPNYKAKGKYANAMIGTREAFRYKYGVFAARVKFPRPWGMHGGFWLQGPAATGDEIDVAEYFGAQSKAKLSIFVHHTTRYGALSTAGKRGGELPTRRILGARKTPYNSYHVYAVDWTPNRYRFWLDGRVMWTTSRPHVSSSPEEIVLSLLTSDWELGRLETTKPVMRVDWVRVWQSR